MFVKHFGDYWTAQSVVFNDSCCGYGLRFNHQTTRHPVSLTERREVILYISPPHAATLEMTPIHAQVTFTITGLQVRYLSLVALEDDAGDVFIVATFRNCRH